MRNRTGEIIKREILTNLPENIRACMESFPSHLWDKVNEIRLRAGHYPYLSMNKGERSIKDILNKGLSVSKVTQDDIVKTLGLMSQNSIYAVQEEIKAGFLTLKGGHRVGLAGKVICSTGTIQNIKYFSSLNIRIARQVIGAGDMLLKYSINKGIFINTLIISPPGCGKTTILRDTIRQVSDGVPYLSFQGKTVGVVDERSELAACFKGIPQNDMGTRTDVLDNCPKAEGIMMMVRSMGPSIIATDEIGSPEDSRAILTAISAGIGVLTTAHGCNIEDILIRPGLRELITLGVFGRIIILSSFNGPGTIEAVYDGKSLKPIYERYDSVVVKC